MILPLKKILRFHKINTAFSFSLIQSEISIAQHLVALKFLLVSNYLQHHLYNADAPTNSVMGKILFGSTVELLIIPFICHMLFLYNILSYIDIASHSGSARDERHDHSL